MIYELKYEAKAVKQIRKLDPAARTEDQAEEDKVDASEVVIRTLGAAADLKSGDQ